MEKQVSYLPEFKERAVRLVHELLKGYESQWAAILSVAPEIGCTPETLLKWVRQSKSDLCVKTSSSPSDYERIKELECENRNLKNVNSILQKIFVCYAQMELDRQKK